MKIFVGIPVYDRKVDVKVASCMLNETTLAQKTGDDLIFQFLPSCSHAAMGRNQLAGEFLGSGCDKLFFLDSDVTFEPGSLLKVAHMPFDLVGGAYRYKDPMEAYPVTWVEDKEELWANEYGLLEVETLPGGFMCISRKVFETLEAAHPDRKYQHHGKEAHCFFQFAFQNGGLYGEDTLFCKEWKETGGRVYLDPEIKLTHWDINVPYPGHIGNWLKNRPQQKEITNESN